MIPQAAGRHPAPLAPPCMHILATHTAALYAKAVQQAAERLIQGDVVALPTETVYGLAANALDRNAVHRLFEVKGRPVHNPVIVHVDGVAMAKKYVSQWPPMAQRFAEAFWPGPLTLVLTKHPSIPDEVTAGGSTVGIRWPSHPIMRAVITACGFPLAAPSANPSNRLSPTQPEHVAALLGDRVSLVVDGGQCQVGIESTVLDLTQDPPCVLRPGIIGKSALEAVMMTGQGHEESGDGEPLRSPGQLPRHYAPKACLRMLSWSDDRDLAEQLRVLGIDAGRVHVLAHQVIPGMVELGRVTVIPQDPEAYARALYSELHQCDLLGAASIVVEALPDSEAWSAIRDRLYRAATPDPEV